MSTVMVTGTRRIALSAVMKADDVSCIITVTEETTVNRTCIVTRIELDIETPHTRADDD